MPYFIVDLWLDGYETEEETEAACKEFIYDQLNMTASGVHIHKISDEVAEQVLAKMGKQHCAWYQDSEDSDTLRKAQIEHLKQRVKELELYKQATQGKESERERQLAAHKDRIIDLEEALEQEVDKSERLEKLVAENVKQIGEVKRWNSNLNNKLAAAREGLEDIKKVARSYYDASAMMSATPFIEQVNIIAEQTLEKMEQKGE